MGYGPGARLGSTMNSSWESCWNAFMYQDSLRLNAEVSGIGRGYSTGGFSALFWFRVRLLAETSSSPSVPFEHSPCTDL